MLRKFPIRQLRSDVEAVWSAEPAQPPVALRDAATVMLLRDGVAGVEVFLIRRHARMAFAAGMHVFPGGGVDERDLDPAIAWVGPPPSAFAEPLGVGTLAVARAIVVAAVRETFEECGVLLAGPADGQGAPARDVHSAQWEERRLALAAGDVGLAEVLAAAGLAVRADLLRPWAHWITPVFEKRRFDTRFFVAAQPEGQQARELGGEADLGGWMPAAEAVARNLAGSVPMMPPTIVAVEELAAAGSVTSALATPRRIRPVMPWLSGDGSPDDAGEISAELALEIDLDGVGGGDRR